MRRTRRLVAFDAARGDAWVSPNDRGDRPMRTNRFKGEYFDPICARLGLAGPHLHDLRHTRASIHLHERTEPHEIQQQLGHSTPAFTLSVYGHLQPGDRRATMNRFSAALDRAHDRDRALAVAAAVPPVVLRALSPTPPA